MPVGISDDSREYLLRVLLNFHVTPRFPLIPIGAQDLLFWPLCDFYLPNLDVRKASLYWR